MTVSLSPVLEGMAAYPFLALAEAKRSLAARGVAVLDFGVGEPREDTPAFIREALRDAVEPASRYPQAAGMPELRAAIAGWAGRRFGAKLDPDTQVVPTLGAKEAIFSLASVVAGDVVAVTVPGYPVAARGARFADKAVLELPLHAAGGFLPDLDAVPAATWARTAILWLNYPNNPTGAAAPLALYAKAAALARRHGFVLASDEAYSELYFGAQAPTSALALDDLRHVLVLNTLSKRSSMPGYRSGFAAGDPDLVAALKAYRPNVGTAPQHFVQRAAIAAWEDEAHVAAIRARYRAKRERLLPALRAAGLEPVGGDASFFLWLADPRGATARLLERGVVLAPGELFGPAGAGCARLALVPTVAECERAAEIVAGLAE